MGHVMAPASSIAQLVHDLCETRKANVPRLIKPTPNMAFHSRIKTITGFGREDIDGAHT